jgi:Raf kinase inhibitor-like YbhB/YbcL family protein
VRAWAVLTVLLLAGCTQAPSGLDQAPLTLSVTSAAFADGQTIPVRYTCQGAGSSPPLRLAGAPANATAYALVLDDPDAPSGTFTHWTFWNLPLAQSDLPDGVDAAARGAMQGQNSAGSVGYKGPCPPAGAAHHYRFQAYAQSQPLDLAAGAKPDAVRDTLVGHVLARGLLVGLYARS